MNSIDEVRKTILQRRLKAELMLNNKSKAMSLNLSNESEEAKEFEESMMKLVSFAKGRVKYDEFNKQDKFHMMELFVTNETILMAIY